MAFSYSTLENSCKQHPNYALTSNHKFFSPVNSVYSTNYTKMLLYPAGISVIQKDVRHLAGLYPEHIKSHRVSSTPKNDYNHLQCKSCNGN